MTAAIRGSLIFTDHPRKHAEFASELFEGNDNRLYKGTAIKTLGGVHKRIHISEGEVRTGYGIPAHDGVGLVVE